VIAIAGATGYIGGKLAVCLREQGHEVRALARDPQSSPELARIGCDVRAADVLDRGSLDSALEGVKVAYYLVHSMGRGAGDGFAERDHEGAANFAAAAEMAGVRRLVFLGGLGGGTEHLDSRHATAETLREGAVPVTYFRAAAVIGAGSESFRTVFYLVRRLPLMITPKWAKTRTQPIAIADAVSYLAAAADLNLAVDREIQLGGPDITTYGGMIDELARAMGRRPPLRLTVPVLTPHLSSLWIGLVTPVDAGVAQPLIEGLASETVVRDPSGMNLFEVERTPLAQSLRLALSAG
jgi:uncharacterized protein YbjT (DUF2867 family)